MFYVSGLVKYDPMRAYLPLPKELKAKQGCLNIQNNDEKCFLWSILASLHLVQHRNNLNSTLKYQNYEHELSMTGIQYPVNIKGIGKFEHQKSSKVNGEKSYYKLVKNLSRPVSSQYNIHNGKQHFHQYCLHGCTSEKVLENHLERRKLHVTQRIKLPEAGDKKGHDKIIFRRTE